MLGQAALGLLLDPGLGKTSISLAAFKILKSKKLAAKMLIVAPLRPAYEVWPAEIRKWANFAELTYTVVHGPDKEDRLAEDVDIYIVTPDGLVWLLADGPTRWKRQNFDILCVDESTKFKTPGTKRFKALSKHLDRFPRRWILTGTPSPNGVKDLFGQIYILDGGRSLGRYITHFMSNFFYQPNPYEKYTWALRPGAFRMITDRIAPLVYVLEAEDHLQMPELITTNIEVTLPEHARRAYKAVEDDFILRMDEDTIVAANAAVAGGKCRQIANGAVYVDGDAYRVVHDAKLDALEDLLDELSGQPTLLLYEFHHDMERIQKRFGPKLPCLGSNLSPKRTSELVQRFNAGDLPILLGHPGSMGHGLNLQGECHHVVWFGITWNLEYYDQAIRRVYRQGQKSKTVFIYHIVGKDTLDERVLQVLGQKNKTQRDLMTALKSA